MNKRLHLEVNKLLKEIYNQIFFPKENFYGYFFRYGITLVFALLLIEFSFFFHYIFPVESLMLLSLFFIGLNSFLGNIKTAIILISFSFFLFILGFPPNSSENEVFVELFIFLISSILISLLISLSKRVDLGQEYGKREKNYDNQIEKLITEKNRVIEEIRNHDEFISIASHELKTPLTTTLLKLQLVLDNIRNVSLANFSIQNLLSMLESAEQQAQTLGKMINDLLNMSLIRNGRMQLELQEVDLNELAQNIINRFSEKAQKEQTPIEVNFATNVKGVFDRIKIEQVLTNLITNAIKYGNQKKVILSTSKNGNIARISVKDHGIGISKDIQNKIFNLFERGGNSHGHQGLGIGLFISNQIIKAHGGKLLLDSSPDKGSTFTIELPLKK